MAKKVLADAQLTVVPRRYFDGDPHPFADLQGELNIDFVEMLFSFIPIRHGCVIWDIVDNSGWGTETAFGGSWLTGLIRAVVTIASDGTTEGVDVFTGDPTFPGEYYTPNFLGTSPQAPHVIFEEGFYTGIESSEFEYFEATDTSFLTGGQSMPGVNEAHLGWCEHGRRLRHLAYQLGAGVGRCVRHRDRPAASGRHHGCCRPDSV